MKKYFDIVETVKYSHRIEIDIEENKEDEFEDFAEQVAVDIENRNYDSKEEILSGFISEFGEDPITFIEDGSPDVDYEAFQ